MNKSEENKSTNSSGIQVGPLEKKVACIILSTTLPLASMLMGFLAKYDGLGINFVCKHQNDFIYAGLAGFYSILAIGFGFAYNHDKKIDRNI